MKKLLLICILIISIIFISGCTSEEKTNSETSTNSQSSEYLINPTNLINGYHSSNYKTYATSKMNSFDGQINSPEGGVGTMPENEPYEGSIPTGKKRIITGFELENDDNGVRMNIVIYEFDYGLKYKESLSEHIKTVSPAYQQIPGMFLETDFIGDCSLMFGGSSDGSSYTNIIYSYNKYGIIIQEKCYFEDRMLCNTEGLKVAKAINNKIK
ncbi:MAG: hypothetical protein MIO93_16375 [ANME-2 cluster archaeon]|jgi:hypothetical protein|nr:hypothetical protein [ANME-2 cluster archaeon]